MLLQYEETDWEFLKRLASHFSTFLVADSSADCGRAYFGIPNINYGTDLLLEEYQISRSQNKYDKIIHSSNDYPVSELLPQELTQWEICSRKRLHLAETVWLNGIEVVVAEFTFHTVKGELIRNYKVVQEKGMLSHRAENPKIYGMSIPATAKERSGNRVRVHMDIDQAYIPGEDLLNILPMQSKAAVFIVCQRKTAGYIFIFQVTMKQMLLLFMRLAWEGEQEKIQEINHFQLRQI